MDGAASIGLDVGVDREEANRQVAQRLTTASPVLVDLRRALDVVPGMTASTVLTAGAPTDWQQVTGLQRRRVVAAAVREGLAGDPAAVDQRIAAGEIAVGSSWQHGCIGPGLAVCTASSTVLVVENRDSGARVFCAVDGPDLPLAGEPADEELLRGVVVPVVRAAVERAGGVPLQPLVAGALRLGDELHMRAGAATTLFVSTIFPALLELARDREADVRATLAFFDRRGVAWFVRLALAAGRTAAEATNGVAGSSVVTAVVQSSSECAIRVSGLGDAWFRAPLGAVEGEPAENPGGDCVAADAVAIGDRSPQSRPIADPAALAYWSMKPAVDVFKVVGSGVTPPLAGHCSLAGGGLVGAMLASVPLACFEAAADAYHQQYRRKPGPT